MPDRTIVRKTLRDLRWQVVGWGLGLAGLAAMLVLLYPAIAEQFEGVELENLGFGEIEDLSNPREYLQVEFFTWAPVLLTVFAIIVGGALLAREEGAGTLELLLSQPLTRRSLFLGKAVGVVIAVVALLLLAGAGFLLTAPWVDLKGEVAVGELVVAPLSLLPFTWFALAATMLTATLTPTRGRAWALMAAAAFLAYALHIASGLVSSIEGLRYVTPYYYSDAQRVLTEGTVWWHQGLLLVAAAVCGLLALVAFERREIGVGRSPLTALLRRDGRGEGADELGDAAREPSSVAR
ncbi:MAG: ABC transporter permease subunit [Chloroflexi bacterium]|nr:ABC transporter permease subunit [Chloroflexota bacterium]